MFMISLWPPRRSFPMQWQALGRPERHPLGCGIRCHQCGDFPLSPPRRRVCGSWCGGCDCGWCLRGCPTAELCWHWKEHRYQCREEWERSPTTTRSARAAMRIAGGEGVTPGGEGAAATTTGNVVAVNRGVGGFSRGVGRSGSGRGAVRRSRRDHSSVRRNGSSGAR